MGSIIWRDYLQYNFSGTTDGSGYLIMPSSEITPSDAIVYVKETGSGYPGTSVIYNNAVYLRFYDRVATDVVAVNMKHVNGSVFFLRYH